MCMVVHLFRCLFVTSKRRRSEYDRNNLPVLWMRQSGKIHHQICNKMMTPVCSELLIARLNRQEVQPMSEWSIYGSNAPWSWLMVAWRTRLGTSSAASSSLSDPFMLTSVGTRAVLVTGHDALSPKKNKLRVFRRLENPLKFLSSKKWSFSVVGGTHHGAEINVMIIPTSC